MKKLMFIFTLKIILITAAFFWMSNTQFRTSNDRAPSSISFENCKDAIKNFIIVPVKKISTVKDLALDKIGSMTLTARLRYLAFLGNHKFQSNSLNYKYADLLNSAINKKLLTVDEVQKLIDTLKSKNQVVVIFNNGKVYPHLIDTQADHESIEQLALNIPENLRSRFIQEAKSMDLTKGELHKISTLSPIKNEEELSRTISAVNYSRTFPNEERNACLGELNSLIEGRESKFSKKFNKNEAKIKKFEDKHGPEKAKIYSKLLYSCQAKGKTISKSSTNMKFFKTIIGVEIVSTAGSYLYVHKDEEKNDEWVKKFSVEMLLNVALASARSGITAGQGSFTSKSMQDYIFGAISDTGPSLGYSAAFSPSKKDVEKKMNELFADPNFQTRLNTLEKNMREEGLLDKYKLVVKTPEGEDVQIEDLKDNEEAKSILAESLAAELYEQQQGEWIHTGDVGLDRYTFHRIWGLQSSFRSIGVNLLIYNTLCMGELDPKKAYLTAVGIYSANNFLFDPIYLSLREKAINQ